MPPRLVCLAILVYWAVAAVGLATRDLLPELSVGGPPDLRAIARAGEDAGPVRWAVQVIDNPARSAERRTVGQAQTDSKRSADGSILLSSVVWFDSGQLLKGTSLAQRSTERISFTSTYEVDPSGNLRWFHAGVRSESDPDELLRIDGRLKSHAAPGESGGKVMEVVSRGPLPFMNREIVFDYQDRGVVGSQFGPLDRLPGLQIGQRWDERVANPFTGKVETVRAEVKARDVIYWNQGPVETLVVVHQSPGLSARTWVRRDGVVLRQEVPLPLLRMVLDRQPDRSSVADGEGGAR